MWLYVLIPCIISKREGSLAVLLVLDFKERIDRYSST